jgi:hypothetical protein
MSNLDADIAHRIKAKGKPEQAQKHSRIEELNAQIAELDHLYGDLDHLTAHFEDGGDNERKFIKTRAQEAMIRNSNDKDALVRSLSLEQPATPREVLIFVLRALSPVQEILSSGIKDDANMYEVEEGHLALSLLRRIIPSLETLSGTSRDLGCGDYYYSLPTDAELVEGLKVPLKTEASIPLHETLKGQLRNVFLAYKAFQDLGEDSDSPLGAPLWERTSVEDNKIRNWNSDEPEVGIAKLITSMTGMIHRYFGEACDEAMAADAALAGLRWFGLEDLYYECFPADAANIANIKKALLKAEAAS